MSRCVCGHPRHGAEGHIRGAGPCKACLRCEREGAAGHVPERCGCQRFEQWRPTADEQPPCICGHYRSEHALPEHGGRCRVRLGFTWQGQLSHGPCDCPGYEPDPDHTDAEEANR